MAECSQKFKDLLVKHEEECFDDWALNIHSPECANARGAILQYVAELEAAKRSLVIRGYTYHGGEVWKPPRKVKEPSVIDMTGGMP